MLIKILVAARDCDYTGHLSNIISERYSDVIDVNICSTEERLKELLASQRFDVALLGAGMTEGADLRCVRLPLLLWAEEDDTGGQASQLKRIAKYQRVSKIVASVLELFAKACTDGRGANTKRAQITAVWSPAGGVGKTTVSLAYAARKVSDGKQALYLNLESFSSSPAYFDQMGRSVSALFEMLEAQEGNIQMLIRGIRCEQDGIGYFCRPENYDDMNILTGENVAVLLDACSGMADEVVVDMASECGERERQVFDLADRVLLVIDQTGAAQIKLAQFTSQHNVFEQIRAKSVLVENRGAAAGASRFSAVVSLPFIQSADASVVYKALSYNSFEV